MDVNCCVRGNALIDAELGCASRIGTETRLKVSERRSERYTAFPNRLRAADSSICVPVYSKTAQGRPPNPPTCEVHERVGLKAPPRFSIDQSPL